MTGNHWWLDAVAGAALAITVDTGTRLLLRHRLEPVARLARPREPAD
jgi:hypothetical protein